MSVPSSPVTQAAPELVMRQLETILASETFKNSGRLSRFLRYVVEQCLMGHTALNERQLGVEVFDRDDGYDTRADPVVRVEARQLRFKLAEYYAKAGVADAIVISLPKGGYAARFEARVVTTAESSGSAAYETAELANGNQGTMEGVPMEAAADGQVLVRRSRIWLYAAAGMLCVAGAIIAWRALSPRQSPSIAVLPFTNLTADPANQYFADGLTDEVTDSLARVKTLRVIARSSSFQFKGKTVDIREVGRLLNVANVLEASVERSGDRIRIVAQLGRVADGSRVWSNTYERRTSELFAVQSELAAGVARSLKATAGIPGPKHIPNAEAHDSLMKARYDMQQATTESLTRAEAEYRHAIDLDPEFAAAYLGLANAQYNKAGATGLYLRTAVERDEAKRSYQKALELDPNLLTAHASLAILAMQYDWDWQGAERELQLALAGPPSANAESDYAVSLIFRRRFAEADQHIQRYQDLDPFSTSTALNLSTMRNLEGRFPEAREISQRLVARYPEIVSAQQMIALTYIEEGRPNLALATIERSKQHLPRAQFLEAMARARAGQREEALLLIRPFEEKYPNPDVPMQWFALVYALMGDEPNTVKWLERSAGRHEWSVLNLAVNPVYAPMRNSAGFRALEKRMGLDQ